MANKEIKKCKLRAVGLFEAIMINRDVFNDVRTYLDKAYN
jgi:hypothetical protein